MQKRFDATKLISGIKKDFSNTTQEDTIEQAVQLIHKTDNKSDEATKRTTLDIPKSLHKKIAQRALDKDLSLKEYFLQLVEKDLKMQ